MNVNDTVRVRHPSDPVEYRLATVISITPATADPTEGRRCRLLFPSGEERTYSLAETVACTRTDDHAALIAAFTDACRSLRDACRITHDYDERITTDVIELSLIIHGLVATRLGVTLDPVDLDAPASTEQVTS